MNNKPVIQLLVTDLDNTLYDWVTYFAVSFTAMIQEAAAILKVPRERLLEDFRRVHVSHHNSEQPFALLEIATVVDRFGHLPRQERMHILDPAFHAFNRARKASLRTYSKVQETLAEIKATGCVIVGHSEASIPNAMFRLTSLGLVQYIDKLYALEATGHGHPIPERADLLTAPPGFIEEVPRSRRKPNPSLLLEICAEYGIPPAQVAYVGDSLTRDISMAKEAGVCAVWAKYGTEFEHGHWDTLVQVTHWTAEDVRRARELEHRFSQVKPDILLNSFDQILKEISFAPSFVSNLHRTEHSLKSDA